jgi:uncharacterized membrane protein
MVSYFEPLLKSRRQEDDNREGFADANTQTIVGNVFIGISIMILAMCLTWLFYWSYMRERTLFIAILSGVMMLFAIEMLILVVMLRSQVSQLLFTFYMGSTAFATFMCLILVIFFSFKASQRLRGSNGFTGNNSYVPQNVQDYINQ